jgi:small-conductance mechanosensitive channel
MTTNPTLTPFEDALITLLIYLGRPDVQRQILIFVLSLVAASLLARIARRAPAALSRRRTDAGARPAVGGWRLWLTRILKVANAAAVPALSIVIVVALSAVLDANDLLHGLLGKLLRPLAAALIYQVAVSLLYLFADPVRARHHHYRLLLPLACVVVSLQLLGGVADLDRLSQAVVLRIGTGAITAGALFNATVGIYFWVAFLLAVEEALQALFAGRSTDKAEAGNTRAVLTLIRYVLTIAGVAAALTGLQLDPATLTALTAGLSVGIGFGMQVLFNNLISGLMILTEGALRPGDVIEVNGQICVVDKVSIRATRVRLLNNAEMVIPNQSFFTSAITTYTGTDRIVRDTLTISAGHDRSPDLVLGILLSTAQAHREVMTAPPPAADVREVNANSVVYRLSYSVAEPLRLNAVKGELYRQIWQAFTEANIQIK